MMEFEHSASAPNPKYRIWYVGVIQMVSLILWDRRNTEQHRREEILGDSIGTPLTMGILQPSFSTDDHKRQPINYFWAIVQLSYFMHIM